MSYWDKQLCSLSGSRWRESMAHSSDPCLGSGSISYQLSGHLKIILITWWHTPDLNKIPVLLFLLYFVTFPLELYTFLHQCFSSCIKGLLSILSQQPYLWLKFIFPSPYRPLPSTSAAIRANTRGTGHRSLVFRQWDLLRKVDVSIS